jgi:hypothetical protein
MKDVTKKQASSPYEVMSGAIVEAVKSAQIAAQAAAAASENARLQADTIKNISQNIDMRNTEELFKEPPPAKKWRIG